MKRVHLQSGIAFEIIFVENTKISLFTSVRYNPIGNRMACLSSFLYLPNHPLFNNIMQITVKVGSSKIPPFFFFVPASLFDNAQ